MKLTLLEMVQNILSSLDSDEVNSIQDTTESRQVAQIIKTKYYDIIARTNLEEHNQLFQLVASTDPTRPVVMTLPANVSRVDWIEYNESLTAEDNYRPIRIMEVDDFVRYTNGFHTSRPDTDQFSLNNITFYYRNDLAPSYCTILQDYYVIFDAYNADEEATLQTSKTKCKGMITPTFVLEDGFIPVLDIPQFPLLLNEAKSTAFYELKQVPNELAMLETRRHWRNIHKTGSMHQPSAFNKLPNFGRK